MGSARWEVALGCVCVEAAVTEPLFFLYSSAGLKRIYLFKITVNILTYLDLIAA